MGHWAALAHELECIAFILRTDGQSIQAAQLFGAAEALRQTAGSVMRDNEKAEYDREVASLRDTTERSAFEAAWSAGRAMSIEAVVDLALTEQLADRHSPTNDEAPQFAQPELTTLIEPLSQREREVLELIAEGLSNTEIAERLFLAPTTVKVHTRHIYEKLNVNSRTQAVAQAHKLKLL